MLIPHFHGASVPNFHVSFRYYLVPTLPFGCVGGYKETIQKRGPWDSQNRSKTLITSPLILYDKSANRGVERIAQVLPEVTFRVARVSDVDIARPIKIESDQVSISAFLLRRHPRDVIVAAVILEHDDFSDMHQGRVEVAMRIDSETLRRVGEFGHDPGLELCRCGRRSGGEQHPAS